MFLKYFVLDWVGEQADSPYLTPQSSLPTSSYTRVSLENFLRSEGLVAPNLLIHLHDRVLGAPWQSEHPEPSPNDSSQNPCD